MKYDMNAKLSDALGREIKEAQDGPSMTLGSACVGAFVTSVEADNGATVEDKIAMHRMLQKLVAAGGDTEFSHEEIILMKARVGAVYTHMLVGPVFDILG